MSWAPLVILFYCALISIQLCASIAVYTHLFEWSPQKIYEFYAGTTSSFSVKQGPLRLLESFVPHILSMGTITFILLHLLGFATQVSNSSKRKLNWLLTTSFLFKNIAGPLVLVFGQLWSYFHIGAFVLYELSMIYVSILILIHCLASKSH